MTASALATAGGLVFGGTADRQFFALHSETGELLVANALERRRLGRARELHDRRQAVHRRRVGRPRGADDDARPARRRRRAAGHGRDVGVRVARRRSRARCRGRRAATGPRARSATACSRPTRPRRARRLFAQECDTCHEIENYTGANFAAKWGGGTLADVYQDFALAMPPANAGGLTPATYASIVAFFASESGYPPGNAALPGDAGQLRSIAIGAPAATP